MVVTLETRKPARLLNMADFSAYPIWVFTTDEEGVEGRDESWVRPMDAEVVPRRSYTFVAAEFKDRRGREFDGYVVVSTWEGHPEVNSGAVFERGESFFVPNREEVSYGKTRAGLMAGLGLIDAEVSSLAFVLKVPIQGIPGRFSGELRLPPPAEPSEVQARWW
jgi:hypothetical protein